jgi:hypothetical protein
MERNIHIQSIGLSAGGIVVYGLGSILSVAMAVVGGMMMLATGLLSWGLRLRLLRQRSGAAPGMLFISREGIEAILPDNSGVTLKWLQIEATRIVFQRPLPFSHSTACNERGISLKSPGGKTICLTEELSGYGELLDILDDLGIPLVSAYSRAIGIQGGHSDWRHRLEYHVRRARN